jgi:hypothetical protein
MTPAEQNKFILDLVQDWAGSKQAALNWCESETIPALNKTVQQAIDAGDFESVKRYLEHIKEGGFA